MAKDISSSERDWRAEADMRTLIEAEAIKRDPKRLAAAKKAARRCLSEKRAEAEAMRALARSK